MGIGWLGAIRTLPRFLGLLGAIGAILLLAGYPPTRNLGGDGAVQAMVAACVVSGLGSVIGALPVALAGRQQNGSSAWLPLISLGVRLLVVLAGTLAVVLGTGVARRPFLLWVGISYLGFLIADVAYGLAQTRNV